MKWYNPIDCTNTHPRPFVAERVDFGRKRDRDFTRGRRVARGGQKVKFWTDNEEADGTPDDVLQHCVVALPVFSKEICRALRKAGISGIQFLPVRLERPNGQVIPGYSIANILNLVPALDVDKSMVTRYGKSRPDRVGEISGILKPVLKRDVLSNFDIIRLAEFPLDYYASERFRDVFLHKHFTGYTFKEVPLS